MDGPRERFADEVAERRVEYDAIVALLLAHASEGIDAEARWRVARAVAAGCLGEQHLWRDLALPNRAALRRLLETYFEPLALDNVMDMRWKKFIYRRLCRWGGFNTCAAPSCGVCPTYSECFGEAEQ
jgi:nitrogen fixation protein NifQ